MIAEAKLKQSMFSTLNTIMAENMYIYYHK
jgi:hypothetical protein